MATFTKGKMQPVQKNVLEHAYERRFEENTGKVGRDSIST